MLHIPILRHGKPYESIDKINILHHATGEPVAQVSMANAGLIGRDIRRMDSEILEYFPMSELIDICRKAAGIFLTGELPIGDTLQPFEQYIKQLSATTGMPEALCRNNATKIHHTLDQMPMVIAGLTRGFDLSILDQGFGSDEGRTLSYF